MENERGQDLVGHHAGFAAAEVSGTASEDGGFWVKSPDGTHLFVLASEAQQSDETTGSTVDVQGVLLQMPRGMQDDLDAPGDMNEDVYVLATAVTEK
jgi:hypothetical protein